MTGISGKAGILDSSGKILVVSDFDGTITTKDTNDEIERVFGNEENEAIRARYLGGEIGIREAMALHHEQIKLTEADYIRFIAENIDVDPGFADFQRRLAAAGVPLVIVSGGNLRAVEIVLRGHKLEVPTVLANQFIFQDRDIHMDFYHSDIECDQSYGPCGNCKARHIRALGRKNDKVVFIGDGFTDRCAARLADYVFAKDRLAAYCTNERIHHTIFRNFYDISRHLFGPAGN